WASSRRWSSSQDPFGLRNGLAAVLGVPRSKRLQENQPLIEMPARVANLIQPDCACDHRSMEWLLIRRYQAGDATRWTSVVSLVDLFRRIELPPGPSQRVKTTGSRKARCYLRGLRKKEALEFVELEIGTEPK